MQSNHIDQVVRSIDPIGCVLSSEGIILEVSAGWRRVADQNGLKLPNYAVGANYLKHAISQDEASLETYRGLSKVLSAQVPFFGTVYPCHVGDHDQKWFFLAAFGSAPAEARSTVVLHLDISQALNRSLAVNRQPTDMLLQTVRRAIREEFASFAPVMAAPTVDHEERKRLAKLTSRQIQLLRLLAKGDSNARIAEQLGVTLSSVKSQTTLLLRALNCANRTQAALFAAKLGLDLERAKPDHAF
jgi:DNA-binding CsgD family transcriptional regulator